jgi:prepilin-type N-terminal cleavage/methylation domain-containing protein
MLNSAVKNSSCFPAKRPGPAAFTLMEMILALGISAVVLAGIGGVFFSSMRLRERTQASIEESTPIQFALDSIRRDLKNAVPRRERHVSGRRDPVFHHDRHS